MVGAAGARWRSGRIALSDGHLAYHRSHGAGPALVLSHGLTDNGQCWHRVADALADDFDVVMLDARGHGESSRIAPGMTWDPGADIAAAVDALEIEAPIVMGHSVGALATAAFAGAFAGRVAKVILEDPPFLPVADAAEHTQRRARFHRQVLQFHAKSDAELAAAARAMHPGWHVDDFPAWIAAKRQVDPDSLPQAAGAWQDLVAGLVAPVLLIHGEASLGSLVTAAIAEEARSINGNVQSVRLAGAGHNVRRENLPAFLAVVRDFLAVV